MSGGPAVVVCSGHRCAALRELAAGPDSGDQLRETVRDTSGAVLISVGCPGLCAQSAVAGISRYDDAGLGFGPVWWLGHVDRPHTAQALRDWVVAGGPARFAEVATDVPEPLRDVVLGLGAPPAVARQPAGRGADRPG